ncbi:Gram-positive signal peptide protein, YSIRK family, partial [Streptococcus mitis SK575]
MENKPSMSRVERLHREKVTRYSIRKYSFGAASVAVAALFMFLGNGAVSVQADQIQPGDTATAQPATPALDKTQLESYISEIETKLSNGSYDNKTEESVAVLKAELESAKATLANATTQAELKTAYSKLVTTANSKLKNKPVEKKETPAVDTTEGKETVGKKAENTEKNPESNSIENTGSKDERNGKPMDKDNAFRAETTETQGNFTYSMEYSTGKEIYLYNEEDADVNITVNSTAGKIKRATVKAGSGQFTLKEKSDAAIAYAKGQSSTKPEEEEVERDDFGWSYHQIITETQGPVTIKITGKPNDTFKGLKPYTKTEDQRAVLGARYLELEDSTGAKLPGGRTPSSPGYFNLVVKSQTYKYDIQPVAEGDKVAVADINNLTPTDINNIKEKIKIQYSDKATTEDARLASKKGEVVNPRSSVVKEIAVANGTVTVTYNDDSVDTTPVASVARTNPVPTVELPYSNADKRQIYVYTGENTDLTFTGKDETTVKDLYLRGPGGVANDNAAAYGFTTGKIDNGAVTNGEGTVSADKRTATIKMTGVTTLKAPNQWTSFIEAKDSDDAKSMTGANYDASTDNAVRQQKPGYVQFVVKSQTDKYDIKAPTEKVTVADPANVTDEEFDTIKAKLKLEYNKSNDDANISKDADVADQNSKIASIEKDAKGNLVVTYTDGSKDTRPLSDFINKAPTVELPYSNADKRQIYVYTGENTDLTFTGKDEKTVKDLYLRGPGGIGSDNTAGYGFTTGKIDNDVVTNGEGTVSADKRTATIKMTGVTTLKAPNQWTSFIVANDNDDASSMPSDQTFDASTDNAVRQQRPGYVQFVVKSQTDKYDIKAPTEKVAVADPANVTEADLAKIKEKLQLEYNQNNDDANISKNAQVTDKDAKIASVTKDDQGNLVVTYTDGSKDTRPLSEFVTLDKQPAIDEVNKAAEKQIAAINSTPNATDEEKAAAIAKVNADKQKALDEIAKPEVTTKDALDKAQTAGTGAIAKDNPVVAKKDEAKQAIDDALTAKNKEIDASPDLTPEEKTKAKEVAKAQADVAKAAVDNATTNAAVDKAKADGTTAVANVTPVAKAEAKKAIAKALEDKNSEIDKRTDLTDEEKTAAKNEAKDKADAQLAKINEQPDAATTPTAAKTAQDAVDAAKTTGVDEVTAVNPV